MVTKKVLVALRNNRRTTVIAASIGSLLLVGAFAAGSAVAAGIPATGALSYSGRLESPDGTPLTGDRQLQVQFWNAASGGTTPLCQTASTTTTLTAGRFTVELPDACTDSVTTNPDLWVEVLVDGVSLGRAKVGAVPFAVEAQSAVSAVTATEASGTLADDIGSIEGQVTTLETASQGLRDGFYAALSAYCQANAGPLSRMVAVVGTDGNEDLTGNEVCETAATDAIGSGTSFYGAYQGVCVSAGFSYGTRGTSLRAAPVLVPWASCGGSPSTTGSAGYAWAGPGRSGMFFCCN